MLCGDLEGWDGGAGREAKRDRIYIYIKLIHLAVQQKPTQHCKAIIFQ